MSLFCFSRSWDRSKINKQECNLARKGHGNRVTVAITAVIVFLAVVAMLSMISLCVVVA